MSAPPPYDEHAEAALLGSLIADATRVPEALAVVSAADFYVPRHGQVFDSLARLHDAGHLRSEDLVTIRDDLRRCGSDVGAADLSEMQHVNGGVWSIEHARIVQRLAVARRLMGAAQQVIADARAGVMEPDEMVDAAVSAMQSIETPGAMETRLAGLMTVAEFIRTTDAKPEPWVIPGMMRRGWRAVIVAGEGGGKTVLMRQLAVAVAAGVHPLTCESVPPARALIIDLENPKDAIAASLNMIDRAAKGSPEYDEERVRIIDQPQGWNLRGRADRLTLEGMIQRHRPQLVVLGPVYKMYLTRANETDELAVSEVQAVLDDLRIRYGFALVLEHHAPKGSVSGRDLVPHGTALWLRWPELGIKLKKADVQPDGARRGWLKPSLEVGRWREDRVQCTWPEVLHATPHWPWRGQYAEDVL